jgi:TolB protein
MMLKKILLFLAVALSLNASYAQLRIEVSSTGASQLPVAISTFKFEEASPHKISSIVAADLTRSGALRTMAGPSGADEQARPDLPRIRALGAEAYLAGSINKLADGRFHIRVRLWDSIKGSDLGGQNLIASSAEMRYAAHRIADWVFEKLTGDRGVSSTRLVYVTKTTAANTPPRFNLWVTDADGEAAISALSSNEPIISPVWSPSGLQLAYVSFESRKPVVYVHDLATGVRRIVANFKGSNSAPAWSPDGRQLVVTLSREGGSQIYVIPALTTGEPKRISTSSSIDTEAVFAPDGKAIYFVSDRGGNPQIYRAGINGDAVQRISFNGNYNISPSVSPDGTKLAFISRVNGAFKLVVQDLSSQLVTALTDTTADESPSFSPNGRQIIYATQVSVAGRWQEALMTTTLDGRVKTKLSAATGDIREPDWGPYLSAPLK